MEKGHWIRLSMAMTSFTVYFPVDKATHGVCDSKQPGQCFLKHRPVQRTSEIDLISERVEFMPDLLRTLFCLSRFDAVCIFSRTVVG